MTTACYDLPKPKDQNAIKVWAYAKEKHLSRVEFENLKLLLQGLSNQEIANKRFVEIKTVKFQITQMFKKMNVQSRLEVATLILRLFVRPEDL